MVHRVEKTVVGWGLAAVWAWGFPLVSQLSTHRVWGMSAGIGYTAAALVAGLVSWPRARTLAVYCALAGAVAVPLTYFLLTGDQQSEVGVIERAGALTLSQGTPYLADPHTVVDYTPYLPGMALFGVPRALLGTDHWPLRVLGDARLWCALAMFVCLEAGRRVLNTTPRTPAGLPTYRTTLIALTASPLVALPLCVSGVDLPLTGLCCLALACAARGRTVATGLALALGCALKWTALPVIAVAAALLWRGHGGRAALRATAVALCGTALLVLPAALLSPHAMFQQVLAFPTGKGGVATPAASPLPGRLLADLGPAGWYTTVALLLLGALAIGTSLLLRPPATMADAAQRLAAGLCTGFLLAPAGRFGYLALPLVLVLWARQAAPGTSRRVASRQAVSGQVAPGQAVPWQVVSGRVAPGQAAPRQVVSGQVASGQTASRQAVSGHVAPGQVAPRQTASRHVTPSPATPRHPARRAAACPRTEPQPPPPADAGSPSVLAAGGGR
ncbi:MAG TPA: glycosyltransferase 87 family protein [Streptomyces sp.]